MTVDTVDERRSKVPAEGAGGLCDNQVTYQGVTYYLSKNLPPLKLHVVDVPSLRRKRSDVWTKVPGL